MTIMTPNAQVFPLFNANVRLFALITLIVEIGATGMIEPDIELRSLRLENYVVIEDYLRLGIEITVMAMLLWQTCTLVYDVTVLGARTYFGSLFNIADVMRQVFSYAAAGLYVRAMTHDLRISSSAMDQPNGAPDFGETLEPSQKFLNFPSLAKREDDYILVSGVNILLTVCMLFKFLMPFPKIAILLHTVMASGKDLLMFLVLMCVIAVGYAIMGVVLFGHVLDGFSTMTKSLGSVMQFTVLGETDYDQLVQASGVFAAGLYFWTFLILVSVLFVNMVLAIVFNAYDTIQNEISDADEVSIMPAFMRQVVLLGRTPSLTELRMPLHMCFKRRLSEFAMFKWLAPKKRRNSGKILACDSDGERCADDCSEPDLSALRYADSHTKIYTMSSRPTKIHANATLFTKDTFCEKHLLLLLDPDYSYRLFGKISLNLENKIACAKRVIGTPANNDLQRKADKTAVNVDEFVYLLHKADEEEAHIEIKDKDEVAIAKMVFELHGQNVVHASSDLSFKKSVRVRLDDIKDAQEKTQKSLDLKYADLNAKLDRLVRLVDRPAPAEAPAAAAATKTTDEDLDEDLRALMVDLGVKET